jgi:hypothetical protein
VSRWLPEGIVSPVGEDLTWAELMALPDLV